MKNHIRVNGQLLQTNKKFSQLKESQKEFISNIFRSKYHEMMKEKRMSAKLPSVARDEVINEVYSAIQERGIWIPYDEVEKYCFGKTRKVVNSFAKNPPDLVAQFNLEREQKKQTKI